MMKRIATVMITHVSQYADGLKERSKIDRYIKKVRRISPHNKWSGYALNVQQMNDPGG
ncbi:MAG: hypothetical protein ACI8PB_004372 [Desulforhopalus sp.]|jgi:hypothetical protein